MEVFQFLGVRARALPVCHTTPQSVFPIFYRHEVAEVAGLTSFSFGESDDNRYIMLFKKVGIYLFIYSFFKQGDHFSNKY